MAILPRKMKAGSSESKEMDVPPKCKVEPTWKVIAYDHILNNVTLRKGCTSTLKQKRQSLLTEYSKVMLFL